MGKLLSAVVLSASPQKVTVSRGREVSFDISGPGLAFVNAWLNPKAPARRRLQPGAVVRITEGKNGWEITQAPEVEGGHGDARHQRWCHPRHGGRLRFQPQQVQPGHAVGGASRARLLKPFMLLGRSLEKGS